MNTPNPPNTPKKPIVEPTKGVTPPVKAQPDRKAPIEAPKPGGSQPKSRV